jgi:hypothetical protein
MSIIVAINLTGIILNIVGVIFIFVFGISPLTRKDVPLWLFTSEEVNNKQNTLHKKNDRYKLLSRIGLLLCIIASIFQMLSCFLPSIYGRI